MVLQASSASANVLNGEAAILIPQRYEPCPVLAPGSIRAVPAHLTSGTTKSRHRERSGDGFFLAYARNTNVALSTPTIYPELAETELPSI
jgi:hypothetical protein